MAISDMKGTVTKNQPTMTGMMNRDEAKVTSPDMSKIKMPTAKKAAPVRPTNQIQPSKEIGLAEKVQNLTDQDKAVLTAVLSPSVSNALKKIAPELSPLLDQAGSSEENMVIPVSVVKNFAAKRYGGQNETESLSSFIADLQESVPSMNTEMDQPVPPETEAIDQGLV
jgi:hypothetical protein